MGWLVAVEAACGEALEVGMASVDVILTVSARPASAVCTAQHHHAHARA